MKVLYSHIAYLLHRHDCVIVDGVGAFIANNQSAVFAIDSDDVLPPSRVISFNGSITHSDGLLAHSVARSCKISFEQAQQQVKDEITTMRHNLQAQGVVIIPGVGELQCSRDGRYDFMPEQARTLALPKLYAPVAKIVEPAIEIGTKTSDNEQHRILQLPLHRRWIRTAAAVLILVVMGFALSTPINVEQAHFASLAVANFTPPRPATTRPLPVPEGLELNIVIPQPETYTNPTSANAVVSSQAKAVSVAKPAAAPTEASSSQAYVMVVASLPSRELAQKFINQNPDVNLQILQSGERFRVYAAAGATAAEAAAQASRIADFANRFPGAWACRR